MIVVSGDPAGASAIESCAPPSPPVNVTVTAPPGDAFCVLTASAGPAPLPTVTVGLVAARVYPLFGNSRNSYVPGVDGMFTVHVRVVTPAPTHVHWT